MLVAMQIKSMKRVFMKEGGAMAHLGHKVAPPVPLNISLTVKLIKLFEQEGIIMNTEFNDTNPPFIFRPSNQILGRKVITFTLKIPSPP
jgi:hypothetical protein